MTKAQVGDVASGGLFALASSPTRSSESQRRIRRMQSSRAARLNPRLPPKTAAPSRGRGRTKGSVRAGSETSGMPQNFIAFDRDQVLLMPPDLRDWLPEDHLAWTILASVV